MIPTRPLWSLSPSRAAWLLGVLAVAQVCAAGTTFQQHNLVSDGFVSADNQDPNLKNPWGMASDPAGGPLLVANQRTGTAAAYNGAGMPFPAGSPRVVQIPQGGGGDPEAAGPTGVAFNDTASFSLSGDGKSGKGLFFFANLDGSISGWNTTGDPGRAVKVVTPTSPAVYTGAAVGSTAGGDFLYAANAVTGKIDVYDSSFRIASLSGSFNDPQVPAGLVPFNVTRVGNRLAVTYAVSGEEQDEAPLGSGAVALFDTDGNLVKHVASGGQLASPWGVTMAPGRFGDFSNALLVGNFSEDHGMMNAFNPDTGEFLGTVSGADGRPIANPYLWAILAGNGGEGGRADSVYLVAGLGDEEHGVLASVSADEGGGTPIPLPPALLAAPLAALLTAGAVRRQARAH